MSEQIEKLKKEIEKLEANLKKDHFGGVVDPGGRKKNENRLKKLRKELAGLLDKK